MLVRRRMNSQGEPVVISGQHLANLPIFLHSLFQVHDAPAGRRYGRDINSNSSSSSGGLARSAARSVTVFSDDDDDDDDSDSFLIGQANWRHYRSQQQQQQQQQRQQLQRSQPPSSSAVIDLTLDDDDDDEVVDNVNNNNNSNNTNNNNDTSTRVNRVIRPATNSQAACIDLTGDSDAEDEDAGAEMQAADNSSGVQSTIITLPRGSVSPSQSSVQIVAPSSVDDSQISLQTNEHSQFQPLDNTSNDDHNDLDQVTEVLFDSNSMARRQVNAEDARRNVTVIEDDDEMVRETASAPL